VARGRRLLNKNEETETIGEPKAGSKGSRKMAGDEVVALSSEKGDMINWETEFVVEMLVSEVEKEGQSQSASMGRITGVAGNMSPFWNADPSSASSMVSRAELPCPKASIPLLLGVTGIWRGSQHGRKTRDYGRRTSSTSSSSS
jgi:hypothetical protein